MPSAAPHPPYCRVSLLAPRARVDVALPADVPVAELVPMVLELVGEPIFGLRPQPWRLCGAGGGPLPPQGTLSQLGVLDGELLRLAPDSPPPPPPVFDDPVDALAAGTGTAGDRRFGAAAVLVIAWTAAGVLAAGPASPLARAAAAAVVAVGAVVHCARRARRQWDEHGQLETRTSALAAVPLAAASALAGTDGLPPTLRMSAACAAAAVAAAGAQVALRVVAPVLVAAVAATVPAGLAAFAVWWLAATASDAGAAMAALALVIAPMLPRAALRLAGLPPPVVPSDAAELVATDGGPDVLDPEELAERSALARGYLAGLVGGCAALAVAGALVAAAAGGWAGPALAAVTVLVLVLRARGFADPAPASTLLGCATIGAAGLAVLFGTAPHPLAPLAAAATLLVTAAVGTLALGRPGPLGSPVTRRALDLLDGLLVATAVPLALAAANVFGWVRSW